MRVRIFVIAIPLFLSVVVAGCGDSGPSLLGKWQETASGGIGQYGQVIEFLDGSNVNLGNSAATYSLVDPGHLKLSDPTSSYILDMKLDKDNLTLVQNGRTSTYTRVTGSTLPLQSMPSPVAGKWQPESPGEGAVLGSLHIGNQDVVEFTGNAMGGTVVDGSSVQDYRVTSPTHFTVGQYLVGSSFDIVSNSGARLVLSTPGVFGSLEFAFVRVR